MGHIHGYTDLTQQEEDLQQYPIAKVKATCLGGQGPHHNSYLSSRPKERTSVKLNISDRMMMKLLAPYNLLYEMSI